jgi:hypothetical protein
MKKNSIPFQIGLVAVSLLVNSFAVARQNRQAPKAEAQLSVEIRRLKQLLLTLKSQEGDGQFSFQQTEAAWQSGYPYLSLYYVRQLRMALEPVAYQQAGAKIQSQGLEAFESEWRRLGEQLDRGRAALKTGSDDRLPAAVRAMMEISLSQVQPYYTSGRLYGLNTTVESGLYYLGQALAHLDFATYCRQLQVLRPRHRLPLRSLEPELKQIEAQTVAAFKEAEGSNRQPLYNAVNSSLKLARELNAERRYSGALLQYLEACLRLNLIGAEASDKQRVTAQGARLHRRLVATTTDQSIGLLFWQMAEQALQEANQKSITLAAVILDKVLPLYFNYLERGRR